MKLQIGEYLIESDPLQFTVKEKRIAQEGKNKGEEYYTNNKYIVRFCDVLKYITDQVLRTNDDMNVIMDKLELINESIKKLETYPVIFIKEEKKETNKINIKERLELINSMKVEDVSASSGEIEYIMVENNKTNRNILNKLGINEDEIDELLDDDKIYIDITSIGFEFSNCYSQEKGFYIKEKDEVIDNE